MSHAARITAWRDRYPGRIAGSVYTVPAEQRACTAHELADAGLDVHVDMMSAADGLPVGVGLDELRDIAETVDRARIGVQLIGSTAFVDDVLPGVLATRPARVFLPWQAFTTERADAVRAAGVEAWIALWREWDGVGAPPWPTMPDGVLVMLIKPGTADSCRMSQLALVAACAPELPVHVDGGVTEDIAPLCLTAGAESMVVGRALLAQKKGSAA